MLSPRMEGRGTDRAQGATARGFTLVEIVCVLVVLGIVAVAVVPRFASLSGAAHRAAVASTAAGFQAAMTMANVACLLKGWAGRDNLPGYANGTVDFNAACFPTDSSGNANTIANNGTRCLRVWNAILAGAPSITTAASGADYRVTAATQVCTFRYLQDGSTPRQFTYDSRSGQVALSNP